MGNHLKKYRAKQYQQLVNSKENKDYYQNGSEWKHSRSESEIKRHRTLETK